MLPRAAQALLLALILLPSDLVFATAREIPTVNNGPRPRDGVKDVVLEEVWRAGGESDDVFFGLVPRVAADRQGRVYVLDSQLCTVYVYSPEGELLRTLFREGEGPGEVNGARDMVLMGGGPDTPLRIGLIQEAPGIVTFVSPDGIPLTRRMLEGPGGGRVYLTSCSGAGDVLLMAGTHDSEGNRPGIHDRLNVLERYDDEGKAAARYAENRAEYDFQDLHFQEIRHLPVFWFSHAVTAGGLVVTAPDYHDYRIEVFRPDGHLEQIIHRQYEPLDRTGQERRRMELMIESAFQGLPLEPRITIQDGAPALAYLHRPLQPHPDGSLWVLSGRGIRPQQPGVMAVFDVFDEAGVFVRQVALHADHDASRVGIFLCGPDRILVVKGYLDSVTAQFGNGTALTAEGEEPQPPEVICYRMR